MDDLAKLWEKHITTSMVVGPHPSIKIHGIDEFNAAVDQLLLEAKIDELKSLEQYSESISPNRIDMVGMHIILGRIEELEALGTSQ